MKSAIKHSSFTNANIFVSFRSCPEVLCKKGILKISQNLQENNCARVSFLMKLQVTV